MVVDQSNRLLLVLRNMPPEKGKWGLPAGYVDAGEDPRLAAEREASEETGLLVSIEEVLDIYHNPPEQGGANLFILYKAQQIGGELKAGDDAAAAQFFALDNLPTLAFASTQDAVRRLQGNS